jgi:hypothetical protein
MISASASVSGRQSRALFRPFHSFRRRARFGVNSLPSCNNPSAAADSSYPDTRSLADGTWSSERIISIWALASSKRNEVYDESRPALCDLQRRSYSSGPISSFKCPTRALNDSKRPSIFSSFGLPRYASRFFFTTQAANECDVQSRPVLAGGLHVRELWSLSLISLRRGTASVLGWSMSSSSSCWWFRVGFRRDRRARKFFTTGEKNKGMVAIPFGYQTLWCFFAAHRQRTMSFQ